MPLHVKKTQNPFYRRFFGSKRSFFSAHVVLCLLAQLQKAIEWLSMSYSSIRPTNLVNPVNFGRPIIFPEK